MAFKPLKQKQVQAPSRFKPIQSTKSFTNGVSAKGSVGFKPLNRNQVAKVTPAIQEQQAPQKQSGGFWRTLGNQLLKPVSSASNLLEDTGKGIAAAGIAAFTPATFGEVAKKVGFKPLQNQADVWSGKNKRTYSTIMNEIANKEDSKFLRTAMKTTGYGADFILDPLNKVRIAELTAKGLAAKKVGKLGLSASEQAGKGERAFLQFGKTNILPSVGNKVLQGSTKLNDAIRGTKYGAIGADALSKVSTSIRPSGISRPEFKAISDATRTFKKGTEYASQQSIKLAADLEKSLRGSGASPEARSAVLHAVEKGDASLVPKGLEDVFQKASAFKAVSEKSWTDAGGATLENYGLAHVATDKVAEEARKKALKGSGKLFSETTPQDIHRQWVKVGEEAATPPIYNKAQPSPLLQEAVAKVEGKIVNLEKEGIKYDSQTGRYFKNFGKETADGGFASKWEPVNVTQATAKEINESLVKQGKEAIFKEDLPTALARGGISTGRKVEGTRFLKATADIKSDPGLALVNKTYEQLTNNESLRTAFRAYDKVLGVWKAQVLVAPSYHVRNEVGNLWNNFLAGTSPLDYANAAKMQGGAALGKLDDASKALMTEMEQQGVIGRGWYGSDITQSVADEIGGASWNPLSQRFGLYKANRAVGTTFEDNARIAHYLSKRREGFSAIEAAKSVDKFLFDYGDLTFIEQNVLKRVLPFYTWSRKNIPLQLEQFVKNPGKFSKAAIAQKDIEEPVSKQNERYMSDYLKKNSPMRIRDNKDGSTEYLLLGQWLPAAQAIQFLSQPQDEILRGITPMVTIPSDLMSNKSFFKDTLGGSEPIERTPGELGSFFGFDMRKKAISVLRGIRVLNEIDKLNPGEVFGGKGKPSVFQGLTDNASEVRGTRHSPDSTQASRTLGFALGKTSTYDPQNSKQFYDYDTQDRMNLYTQQLTNALKLGQTDLAGNILKEMEQFNSDREGKQNKNIQNYNLMGEQYFQDLAQNKQAESNRTDVRDKMKEMIRTAITSGDNKMLQEALKLDPSYAKDAVKDALTEKNTSQRSPEEQKMYYNLEQMKTRSRLNPFY